MKRYIISFYGRKGNHGGSGSLPGIGVPISPDPDGERPATVDLILRHNIGGTSQDIPITLVWQTATTAYTADNVTIDGTTYTLWLEPQEITYGSTKTLSDYPEIDEYDLSMHNENLIVVIEGYELTRYSWVLSFYSSSSSSYLEEHGTVMEMLSDDYSVDWYAKYIIEDDILGQYNYLAANLEVWGEDSENSNIVWLQGTGAGWESNTGISSPFSIIKPGN